MQNWCLDGNLVEDSIRNKPEVPVNWLNPTDKVFIPSHIFQEYLKLIKPRIALLIVISTAVGYCFGTGPIFRVITLINALLGTGLLAAGSATLNQWYERDIDAKMHRTRKRPIPCGTIQPSRALYFGITMSVLGTVELALFTNLLAAALGLATLVGYLFIYTPLKRKGPICTTVGAVPGAMPPLIGFAAASGHLSVEAWVLFGILFFWQFPHFHAIARMYHDDYARGGVKMLAVVRPDGKALRWQIVITLLLLIPVSLTPTFIHMAGTIYLVGAFLLGVTFLYFGLMICWEYTYERARRLLLASVVYIPVLFALLVFDSPRFGL